VPTLVGTNVDTLEPTIGSHGWEIQRTDIYQDLTVAGQILGQDPAEGTQLARGGVLALTVSLGPPPVDVPTTIVGKPIAEATASLQAVGLKVGALTRQYDERVPADSVIALAPGVGAQAPKGSAVPLVVSDGPAPRTIPAGVVGATQDAATAKLRDLGLKVSVTTDSSETVPAGTVISVNPAQGGQAARDSTVTLVVSSGLPMVTVPDVSGHSVTDAANLLQAKGLNVSGTQGNPLGTVKSTNPAAGTSVHKGSAVLLIIG
jgi:beta-lactam-binding protein with PASTA domain